MTFAVRGIAVSFSIFALLYCALSLAVCALWQIVRTGCCRYSAQRCVDVLFALRMSPSVIATAVTLVFAVPSFLLLEPRVADEPMTAIPAVLAVCGIALILAGIGKAIWALTRASRMIARWSREASAMALVTVDGKIAVSLLPVAAAAPPLTAAGVFQPSVWLSCAAMSILSEQELHRALRHEAEHVHRHDNLRKVMLCLVAFPGMAKLENAWQEATEMAADDAAVSSPSEALDLAAAVIKLSRLAPLDSPPELTTALVHGPAASVNARVQRLISWRAPTCVPKHSYVSTCVLCLAASAVAALALSYPQLLLQVHAATEWLVR